MFVNDSWGPLMNKDALFVAFRKARVRETTVDMVSEELLGGGIRWRRTKGRKRDRGGNNAAWGNYERRDYTGWWSQPIEDLER